MGATKVFSQEVGLNISYLLFIGLYASQQTAAPGITRSELNSTWSLESPTYSMSVPLTNLAATSNTGLTTLVLNCLEYNADPSSCTTCQEGYLKTLVNSGAQDFCILKCPDGSYPSITAGGSALGTSAQQCLSCDASCRTCIGAGSSECSSCNSGFYFTISDVTTKGGTCSTKSTPGTPQVFNYQVTGDRINGATYPSFVDLMSAVHQAFLDSDQFTTATVNIYL
jgi:hypothetical protein